MFWLLLIWLCLFLTLVGCGLSLTAALRRLGGATFGAPLSTFQLFWFGYTFVILFLQLVSLVSPIGLPALFILTGVALAGFGAARGPVLARLRSFRRRPRPALAIGLAIAVTTLGVASRAGEAVDWYDTHLYHLQIVQWARAFPAIPGIANLHFRLAYNNSVHLFAALTDVWWRGQASHIANGLLVSVVTIQLATRSLASGHARARAAAAFSLLVLPFVLARIWSSSEVASLSSDLALGMLCIVIVLELLPLRSGPGSDLPLALLFALSSVATTTKLGGAGMLAVVGLLVVRSLLHHGWSTRRALGLGVLPALLLLGYLTRQIILSGWLLFPMPLGNLQLDWSLPEPQTLEQFRWIESWARMPFALPAEVLDQGFWHWFEPWLELFRGAPELPALAATVALACLRAGVMALAWHRGDSSFRSREPAQIVALAAALVSLVLWFRGAPDLRFGAVFFWILLAAVGAPVLGEALKERAGAWLALGLCFALSLALGGLDIKLPQRATWTEIAPIEPITTTERVHVSPGLHVHVPSGGGVEDRCSNAPLPCTPYPRGQRLRRPRDLASGFSSAGALSAGAP
jgi:hypothetical protein